MSGAGSSANLSSVLLANVSKPEALAFIFAMTFNMPCQNHQTPGFGTSHQ